MEKKQNICLECGKGYKTAKGLKNHECKEDKFYWEYYDVALLSPDEYQGYMKWWNNQEEVKGEDVEDEEEVLVPISISARIAAFVKSMRGKHYMTKAETAELYELYNEAYNTNEVARGSCSNCVSRIFAKLKQRMNDEGTSA